MAHVEWEHYFEPQSTHFFVVILYYYYYYYYYYLLQLGFHPVAVVLTLVHTIQMDI
jgi:hypothetical protein